MRRISILAVALLTLLLTAIPTFAAEPPIHQPGEYIEFNGWGSLSDDRTEVDVSISIHNSRDVLQVHVTRVTYALHNGDARLVRQEFGTAFPDPAQLTIDDMSTVTLVPVAVELFDCDAHGCRSTGLADVSVLLTGIGQTAITTERGAYRSDGCNYRYADVYESRAATASLVFGDDAFSGDGSLEHDTYNTYVVHCDSA